MLKRAAAFRLDAARAGRPILGALLPFPTGTGTVVDCVSASASASTVKSGTFKHGASYQFDWLAIVLLGTGARAGRAIYLIPRSWLTVERGATSQPARNAD